MMHEERWQMPTTKCETYPSGKAAVNAQDHWGRGSKPPQRGSMLPTEHGVPCTIMVLWGIGGRRCFWGSSNNLS
jgi:hypothetical protein